MNNIYTNYLKQRISDLVHDVKYHEHEVSNNLNHHSMVNALLFLNGKNTVDFILFEEDKEFFEELKNNFNSYKKEFAIEDEDIDFNYHIIEDITEPNVLCYSSSKRLLAILENIAENLIEDYTMM